jgi:hypothetical protein
MRFMADSLWFRLYLDSHRFGSISPDYMRLAHSHRGQLARRPKIAVGGIHLAQVSIHCFGIWFYPVDIENAPIILQRQIVVKAIPVAFPDRPYYLILGKPASFQRQGPAISATKYKKRWTHILKRNDVASQVVP